MNGVIHNVLELSARSAPKPVKVDMQQFLQEFVAAFVQGEQDAVIDVKVTPPSTQIRIDISQLQQVLTNLVNNGLRYSREHTNVASVRLEGGIQANTERPYLLVIDDGTGVPKDEVANLFEPFFTTENTGSGLGLYISKELCEANQARLSYQPAESGGSCFRINFAHPDRITL